MRLFTHDTAWELARKHTRHTVVALEADDDQARLAPPLRTLLNAWSALELVRRDADDALTGANARIKVLDRRLDRQVVKLSEQITADNKPLHGKFFTDPPNAIVKLALGAEIDRVNEFFVVREANRVQPSVDAVLQAIAKTCADGTAALAARDAAEKGVAAVALKIDAWKDSANTGRQVVENTLDSYATANQLGRKYSDDFFPDAPVDPAKKKAAQEKKNKLKAEKKAANVVKNTSAEK
jgi:hypothetical protein